MNIEKLNAICKAASVVDMELKALTALVARCDDELIERASSVDIEDTLLVAAGMVSNLTGMLKPALDAEFGDGFSDAVAYGRNGMRLSGKA